MEIAGYRLPAFASLVLWGLAWEIVGQLGLTILIPPLSGVLVRFVEIAPTETFQNALMITARTFAIGVAIAIAVGVPVGIAMGRLPVVDRLLLPWVSLFVSAPLSALVPVTMALFGFGETSLGFLSVPFTVFATIGIINAMNMIDGADGMVGLLGLAALAMLCAASVYAGNTVLAERVSVLAAALAGFLLWNVRFPWRPRAKVFLGNAGSAFLGLVIAWVSFRLTQNPGHPVNPVLALWLLPIPVMDTLVLIVRRLREGRSPFSAGRDHIHHFMQDAGFGPTRAALWLTLFSLLCGLLVGQAMRMDVPTPLLLLAYVLLCAGWLWLSADRDRTIAFFRRLPGAGPARMAGA